jgi:4a-hydroxytetrahydrobiopterin dehydratase
MKLTEKKCEPCEGGVPRLQDAEIHELMKSLDSMWILTEGPKIKKEYRFVNFVHTMNFVNKIAVLAEQEGHHPDLSLSYGKCIVELWTHSIDGLSENDFILAAKIDTLQ